MPRFRGLKLSSVPHGDVGVVNALIEMPRFRGLKLLVIKFDFSSNQH